MRKALVGAAFLLPLIPAAAAVAAALPDVPPVPVLVDLGRGVDGDGPADPTAGADEIFGNELGSIGGGVDGTNGGTVYVEVGKEGAPTSVGRVGVGATTTGVQVYGEDYTDGNVIATVAGPVLSAVAADDDCPAADVADCDAALVTVVAPATEVVPAAPVQLPEAAEELGDGATIPEVLGSTVNNLGNAVGGLLGG